MTRGLLFLVAPQKLGRIEPDQGRIEYEMGKRGD